MLLLTALAIVARFFWVGLLAVGLEVMAMLALERFTWGPLWATVGGLALLALALAVRHARASGRAVPRP